MRDGGTRRALSSPSVGDRIVRAQREGLERFAEFLVSVTASTPANGASETPISLERAYMLTSGLRSTALRAIERGDELSHAGAEGKAVFKAVLS